MGYSSNSGYASGSNGLLGCVILIALILGAICAYIGAATAKEKGYDSRAYGVLCFFLSIPALMAVIAMPNVKLQRQIIEELKRLNASSELNELLQCEVLFRSGAISEDDFEAIKKKVMSEYAASGNDTMPPAHQPVRSNATQGYSATQASIPSPEPPLNDGDLARAHIWQQDDGFAVIELYIGQTRVSYNRTFWNEGNLEPRKFCANVADEVEKDIGHPLRWAMDRVPETWVS